jgi:hypothetical protein
MPNERKMERARRFAVDDQQQQMKRRNAFLEGGQRRQMQKYKNRK